MLFTPIQAYLCAFLKKMRKKYILGLILRRKRFLNQQDRGGAFIRRGAFIREYSVKQKDKIWKGIIPQEQKVKSKSENCRLGLIATVHEYSHAHYQIEFMSGCGAVPVN